MASWNAGGLCLSIRSGTPFGPAALWFGVRRRAYWKMAGVIWPIGIGTEGVGVGRTWSSQGNGAPGGSVGSEYIAVVSSFSSCTTSIGVVSSRPDVSSRLTESSVHTEGGVIRCLLRSAEDGLKGSAWLFYEHAKKRLAAFQTVTASHPNEARHELHMSERGNR